MFSNQFVIFFIQIIPSLYSVHSHHSSIASYNRNHDQDLHSDIKYQQIGPSYKYPVAHHYVARSDGKYSYEDPDPTPRPQMHPVLHFGSYAMGNNPNNAYIKQPAAVNQYVVQQPSPNSYSSPIFNPYSMQQPSPNQQSNYGMQQTFPTQQFNAYGMQMPSNVAPIKTYNMQQPAAHHMAYNSQQKVTPAPRYGLQPPPKQMILQSTFTYSQQPHGPSPSTYFAPRPVALPYHPPSHPVSPRSQGYPPSPPVMMMQHPPSYYGNHPPIGMPSHNPNPPSTTALAQLGNLLANSYATPFIQQPDPYKMKHHHPHEQTHYGYATDMQQFQMPHYNHQMHGYGTPMSHAMSQYSPYDSLFSHPLIDPYHPDCKNLSIFCTIFAATEGCKRNPLWMIKHCPINCGTCHLIQPAIVATTTASSANSTVTALLSPVSESTTSGAATTASTITTTTKTG